MLIFSYPDVFKHVMGATENPLNETVLLSTHNMCFDCKIKEYTHSHLL